MTKPTATFDADALTGCAPWQVVFASTLPASVGNAATFVASLERGFLACQEPADEFGRAYQTARFKAEDGRVEAFKPAPKERRQSKVPRAKRERIYARPKFLDAVPTVCTLAPPAGERPDLPSIADLEKRFFYSPSSGRVFYRNRYTGAITARFAKPDRRGYVCVWIAGKTIGAHRLAWALQTGSWPSLEIDHLDGNPSNNRWTNLRHVDRRTNAENRRRPQRNNKTGLQGVSREVRGKRPVRYRAQIVVDGTRYRVGRFPTPEQAHEAYVAAKRQLHAGCTL